jgi:hypothetical protein
VAELLRNAPEGENVYRAEDVVRYLLSELPEDPSELLGDEDSLHLPDERHVLVATPG